MSNNYNTTNDFFDVLHKLGLTANIKGAVPGAVSPLFLKWGYVEDIESNNHFFREVVNSFESPIKWAIHDSIRESKIYPNGFVRWWSFYPAKVDELMIEKNIDLSSALQWFTDNDLEFCVISNFEYSKFVEHLIRCFELRVSVNR